MELRAMITERAFSQQVYDLARRLNWRAVRFPTWRATGTSAGYPDITMVRGGRLLFTELKSDRPGASPTTQQREWMDALESAGAEVYLWRPSDLNEVVNVLAAQHRPRTLPAVICSGCGAYFKPRSARQRFHDEACRKLHWWHEHKRKGVI